MKRWVWVREPDGLSWCAYLVGALQSVCGDSERASGQTPRRHMPTHGHHCRECARVLRVLRRAGGAA